MLTLRAAATLLANADSPHALRPLAAALGFAAPPVPLDPRDTPLAGMLLDAEIVLATLAPAAAQDGLALLAATLPTPSSGALDPRDLTRRLLVALLRHAPTRHWCTITRTPDGRTLCLATVVPAASGARGGDRVAALVVDRERVTDSDAETVRALASVTETDGLLRHARFTDILRRDALSARFYRALEHTVALLADSAMSPTAAARATGEERRELALLCTSRCLFLAFLEARGWLDGDRNFLLHRTASVLELGGGVHQRLLKPLFFGTLNTPHTHRAPAARALGDVPFLNGGLFAPTRLERRHGTLRFHDDALVALVGDLLDRYRFTAREDSTAWSEAAIDPEMLGRAFESLMHQQERHASGAFYTPPALVADVVGHALPPVLPMLPVDVLLDPPASLHDARWTSIPTVLKRRARERVESLRVLDPACGSGAFLVHLLERLTLLSAACGDTRPLDTVRRSLLTRTIFGVDRNPMAVWLCELRLWLSVVIDSTATHPRDVPPLPNLDHNIRVGDTIAGGDFTYAPPAGRRLGALRERYTRAVGRRKHTLATALDREERTRALAELGRRYTAATHARHERLSALRSRDLFGARAPRTAADTRQLADLRTRTRALQRERRRLELGGALPFRFAAQFADVAALGGFSLVVGNPPWVRPHALSADQRVALRADFRVVRDAAWTLGAARAGASQGFAAQADLSAAFIERAVRLLAPDGALALLVPAKLWRALAGGGVRSLLLHDTTLLHLHDWSDAPALFDAAVYPSLVVARRDDRGTGRSPAGASGRMARAPIPDRHRMSIHVARGRRTESFDADPGRIALSADPGAPWVLLPPRVRAAFDTLRLAGPALGDSPLGRPTLGVKCGCNDAFLVRVREESMTHDDELALVENDARTATIERRLLRPVLRGDAVRARGADAPTGRAPSIIWTHDPDDRPLPVLPPAAARWFGAYRRQLQARADARGRRPWWSLFRTDSARVERPRLAWADIGRSLHAAVLRAGDPTVPLNSCYVLRLPDDDDAFALHALLSAPPVRAWMDALAEPARGGYRRYLGWTVATVPVPADWAHARALLAPIGARLASTTRPDDEVLTDAAARAFRLQEQDLLPLVRWLHP